MRKATRGPHTAHYTPSNCGTIIYSNGRDEQRPSLTFDLAAGVVKSVRNTPSSGDALN